MEKKNTMLLTVIAVATLLVAVVGATFAYFSLTLEGSSSETTANVQTGAAGSVVMNGSKKTLTLKVNSTDMIQASVGKYYAKDEAGDGDSVHGELDSVLTHELATATLSNGGKDLTYECNYTVTVASESGLTEAISGQKVKTGDLVLTVTGPGIETAGKANEIDLSTLSSEKTLNGKFTLKDGETTTGKVEASLYLDNKVTDQSYLAGQNFSVKITTAGGTCTVTAAGAGA